MGTATINPPSAEYLIPIIRTAGTQRDAYTIGLRTADALQIIGNLAQRAFTTASSASDLLASSSSAGGGPFTGITDLAGLAGSVGTAYNRGDGKLISPVNLTFTPPTDPAIGGVTFLLVWDDTSSPPQIYSVPVGRLGGGTYTIQVDTPNSSKGFTVYALTYNSSGQSNPFNPTATPHIHLTVGSGGTGTISLGNTILSSVQAYFSLQSGLFSITNAGITTPLIANFAVTSSQLAAAAVTAPKVANLAIGTANIQAAAITTVLIANAAITNALIASAAVLDANIGSCSINKLLAGTATFSGTATFQNGSGDSVVISSTGVAITNGTLTSIPTTGVNVSITRTAVFANTWGVAVSNSSASVSIGSDTSTSTVGCFLVGSLDHVYLEYNPVVRSGVLSMTVNNLLGQFGPTVIQCQGMPSSYPGAGTFKLWYDPSDGDRVKFAA